MMGLIKLLKSMTGYGRNENTIQGRHISFEIKAVNHKYFEFSARISRGYLFLEDKLKQYIQNRISRGKIDIFLQIETLEESEVQVQVNQSLAAGYVKAFKELKERHGLTGEPSLELLAANSEIFSIHKAPENEALILAAVERVAEPAIESMIKMRRAEGMRLREDVLQRAARIMEIVGSIEEASFETVSAYEKRLREKIEETLSDSRYDDQRVLTEVAIFADKVAVDEETVRLRSHFAQLSKMLESDKPIGRKMDFLVQEMNREANTIGSKCLNPDIAYLIVEIKSEIEKIREQIQNVE